jgi:hypothetical protein
MKRKEIQRHRRAADADLERVMERGLMQPYLLNFRLRRILQNTGIGKRLSFPVDADKS